MASANSTTLNAGPATANAIATREPAAGSALRMRVMAAMRRRRPVRSRSGTAPDDDGYRKRRSGLLVWLPGQWRQRDGDGQFDSAGGGTATAMAMASGGAAGSLQPGGVVRATGAANATSTAKTAKGALAQAQSTAVGSSGQAQSTAGTSFTNVKVQSATAPTGSTATTNAVAQASGSGQAFANPGQTAYAFSMELRTKPTRRRSSGARALSPTRC